MDDENDVTKSDDVLKQWVLRCLNSSPEEARLRAQLAWQVQARSKMLMPLIGETRRAVEAKLYRVALQAALTLPDICGSVEYPELKDNVAERYIRWCETHLACCHDQVDREFGTPYVSGEVVYNLRNNLLHGGKAAIDKAKFKRDETNVLDRLTLVVGISEGLKFQMAVKSSDGRNHKTITLTVAELVHDICDAAEKSYHDHQAEFDRQLTPILDYSSTIPNGAFAKGAVD